MADSLAAVNQGMNCCFPPVVGLCAFAHTSHVNEPHFSRTHVVPGAPRGCVAPQEPPAPSQEPSRVWLLHSGGPSNSLERSWKVIGGFVGILTWWHRTRTWGLRLPLTPSSWGLWVSHGARMVHRSTGSQPPWHGPSHALPAHPTFTWLRPVWSLLGDFPTWPLPTLSKTSGGLPPSSGRPA